MRLRQKLMNSTGQLHAHTCLACGERRYIDHRPLAGWLDSYRCETCCDRTARDRHAEFGQQLALAVRAAVPPEACRARSNQAEPEPQGSRAAPQRPLRNVQGFKGVVATRPCRSAAWTAPRVSSTGNAS